MGCCESRRLEVTNQKNALYTDSTGFSQEHQTKREYLHALLTGIQEQCKKDRLERLSCYCQIQSPKAFESYLATIAKSIQSEKSKIQQLFNNLTSHYGTLELNENDIYSDVLAYLQLRKIGQEEVKQWITQKIKIVKRSGKELASKLKNVANLPFQTTNKIEIFQTMIQDILTQDKGFLLSIALQFIYKDNQKQKAQWIASLQQIHEELNFMIK